jgi:integrase
MSIRRRILPSGLERWAVDWYDSAGKRCQKLCKSKAEAKKLEAAMQTRKFEEQVFGVVKPDEVKFERLIDEYKKYARTNTPRSYETSMYAISSFEDFFKGKIVSNLTVKDIELYKSHAIKEIKSNTLNRYLTVLRRMLNLAVEWGYLNSELPKKIKNLKEPPGRVRFLSREETERLLRCCIFPAPKNPGKEPPKQYLYMMVLFALNTGLRKGEIQQLRWKRIDFENGFVHVEHNPEAGEETKDSERRDIPLNNLLMNELRKWKEVSSPDDNDLVFPVQDIKRSFRSALNKARIKDFRFHDLRHSFASHLVMQGVDLPTVSKLLGHAKIDMTMKYSHLSPDHRKEAVLRLENLMSLSTNLKDQGL